MGAGGTGTQADDNESAETSDDTSGEQPEDDPPRGDTGTTGGAEPDGPPSCAEPALDSDNAVASDELRLLMEETQATIDAGDYAGLVHVIDGEIRLGMTGYFYCVQLSLRFDWLERLAVQCIEHHDVDSTMARMTMEIEQWPEVPVAIADLDDLEGALSDCDPGFSPAYEPCSEVVAGEWFTLKSRVETPGGCYDADWAEVDAVTGEMLDCHVDTDCATTG